MPEPVERGIKRFPEPLQLLLQLIDRNEPAHPGCVDDIPVVAAEPDGAVAQLALVRDGTGERPLREWPADDVPRLGYVWQI
jgi:hypothetical protein